MPVPTVTPAGPPARAYDYQHIDVNPNQFGAGIGAAMREGGRDLQEGAAALGQAAIQRQNIMNQVAADNATNDFQDRLMKIVYGDPASGQKGYFGLSGRDAMDGAQGATQAIQDARNQVRGSLQNNFQIKEFDNASRRMSSIAFGQIGSHFSRESTKYATTTNMATIDLGYRAIAADPMNPDTFNNNLADIHRAIIRNGQLNGASDEFTKNELDKADAKAIGTRLDAMENVDPGAAMKFFNDNKSHLDGPTQARYASKYKKAGETAASHTIVGDALNFQTTDWRNSSGVVDPYNLGNVKTPEGARTGAQIFQRVASPTDGVTLTANTLRDGYKGLTLGQIANKWAPSDPQHPNQSATWLKNVSYATGWNADYKPNLDDPATLIALTKGIATAEKTPGQRIAFTDDVVANGVQASLAGQKPKVSSGAPVPQSEAHYWEMHQGDILDKVQSDAEAYAAKNNLGQDWIDSTVGLAERQIKLKVATENAHNKADDDLLVAAANGAMSKGSKPMTLAQLQAINPQVADTYKRAQDTGNYQTVDRVNKILENNSKKTVGYGPAFPKLLQQVYSGKITDAAQFDSYIGTNTGITTDGNAELRKQLTFAQTPQGHAEIGGINTFLDWAHGQITKSNAALGMNDPKGDERWGKFLTTFLSEYAANRAKGVPQTDILNQKGAHSLTPLVAQYAAPAGDLGIRLPSEPVIGADGNPVTPATIAGQALGQFPPAFDLGTKQGAAQAFVHGKITRGQLADLIAKNGWLPKQAEAQPQTPSAPLSP